MVDPAENNGVPRYRRRIDAWDRWSASSYHHRREVTSWVWDRTIGRYARMPGAASPATALAWSQSQGDARAAYNAFVALTRLKGRYDPIPWITLPSSLQVTVLRPLSHIVRDNTRGRKTRLAAAAAQTWLTEWMRGTKSVEEDDHG